MKEIVFSVPGEPQGKARARVVRLKNGMTSSFTPEKTVNYENLIKLCFQEAAGQDFVPMDGIFAVDIEASFGIPKSWPKNRVQFAIGTEQPVVRPTKKPDVDNIAKVVCDSLNGIAYRDDSSIVTLRVKKMFSQNPRVTVRIRNITDTRDKWSQK